MKVILPSLLIGLLACNAPTTSTPKMVAEDIEINAADTKNDSTITDADTRPQDTATHETLGTGDNDSSTDGEQCIPDCTDKQCGTNGCGGMCGICLFGQTCRDAQCEKTCEPICDNKTCGSDGCNGSCGDCAQGEACGEDGQCYEVKCSPNCAGFECGPDGCGGTCGACTKPQKCIKGSCTSATPE